MLSAGIIEKFAEISPPLTIQFKVLGFDPSDGDLVGVVASSLPWMRHLELLGFNVTDAGLSGLALGCPVLEVIRVSPVKFSR